MQATFDPDKKYIGVSIAEPLMNECCFEEREWEFPPLLFRNLHEELIKIHLNPDKERALPAVRHFLLALESFWGQLA